LRIELGYKVALPNMPELTTIARLPDPGASKGMLLFADYREIRSYAHQLRDAGYGFSVMDEPAELEEFQLTSFKDMFVDWGWSGALGDKPP
jgi:hypothetical protein